MTWIIRTSKIGIAVTLGFAFLAVPALAAEFTVEMAPGESTTISRSGGTFSYDLVLISPLTQSWPTIDFQGPYYYSFITNTGSTADTYRLKFANYVGPSSWFVQVCIRSVCYADSVDLPFAIGEADTIGAQLTPFNDGIAEWDFIVESLGSPGLSDTFHMKLYAGAFATGVGDLTDAVAGLELRQNIPNPVRDHTSITFALPNADRVNLGVFDVAGRRVADLRGGAAAAGAHTVGWDGRGASGEALPAGVYFYRLQTSAGTLTKQMTLVN